MLGVQALEPRCCDTEATALARCAGALPSVLRLIAAAHLRAVQAFVRNDHEVLGGVLTPAATLIMDPLGQGRVVAKAFALIVLAAFVEEHEILYHDQRLIDAQLLNDGDTCTTTMEQRFLVRSRATGRRSLVTARCSAVWVASKGRWLIASAYPTAPLESRDVEAGSPVRCGRCGAAVPAHRIDPPRVRFLNPRNPEEDATSRRFSLIEIE